MPEKRTNKKMRSYSDSGSPYLPPKYTSKNSTIESPIKTHPNNETDIELPQNTQTYETLIQNIITLPESPAEVFIKFNSS